MERKVVFFKDLDIAAVKEAQLGHAKLKSDYDKLQQKLQKADEARLLLYQENKQWQVQAEHFEKEIRATIEHNDHILGDIKKLRSEIVCEEVAFDND